MTGSTSCRSTSSPIVADPSQHRSSFVVPQDGPSASTWTPTMWAPDILTRTAARSSDRQHRRERGKDCAPTASYGVRPPAALTEWLLRAPPRIEPGPFKAPSRKRRLIATELEGPGDS